MAVHNLLKRIDKQVLYACVGACTVYTFSLRAWVPHCATHNDVILRRKRSIRSSSLGRRCWGWKTAMVLNGRKRGLVAALQKLGSVISPRALSGLTTSIGVGAYLSCRAIPLLGDIAILCLSQGSLEHALLVSARCSLHPDALVYTAAAAGHPQRKQPPALFCWG